MSGHSHAKTVKRVKEANAAKRGKAFSKLSKLISLAAKDGQDPQSNSKLRRALDEAKKYNMPKENIERAIKKATGAEGQENLAEVLYEIIAPFGVYIIVEGITDNKNRALSEIKQISQKHNAKLAQEGSLQWQFAQKGFILIKNTSADKETLELKAIEAGAEDLRWRSDEEGEYLEIITAVENLETAKANIEKQGLEIESSALGWQAKQGLELQEKEMSAIANLLEALDESETAQEIYSNIEN